MKIRKALGAAALVAAAAAGAAIALTIGGGGTTVLSSAPAAQTTSTAVVPAAANNSGPSGAAAAPDRPHGPHTVGNCTETPLTGDDKTKAEDAAKAAVPGATVDRSETDCDGAKYEVHMTKSDGSHVAAKEDANFKVTSVEACHGPGHGPDGQRPDHGPDQGPQAPSTGTQPTTTSS